MMAKVLAAGTSLDSICVAESSMFLKNDPTAVGAELCDRGSASVPSHG